MANVYGSSVAFTKEKNVWTYAALVQFGPSGAVSMLGNYNNRGICSITNESVAFTGSVVNSVTSLGSVTSFAGVFAGMTITGPAGDLQAATTVSSFSVATNVLVLSKQAITTDPSVIFNATGGRYRFQFGTLAAQNLTPFVKLMGINVMRDMSTGSVSGAVGVMQQAPSAPNAFIIDNKISTRTIPQTQATSSTDASVALQFGYGVGPGTGFQAVAPADGEILRVVFHFGNSTGP